MGRFVDSVAQGQAAVVLTGHDANQPREADLAVQITYLQKNGLIRRPDSLGDAFALFIGKHYAPKAPEMTEYISESPSFSGGSMLNLYTDRLL